MERIIGGQKRTVIVIQQQDRTNLRLLSISIASARVTGGTGPLWRV